MERYRSRKTAYAPVPRGPEVHGPDLASGASRRFYRHAAYMLLRRAWLPVLLALLLGGYGAYMGHNSHSRSYRLDMSVNLTVEPGISASGREIAVTAKAMFDSAPFYERVRAMLSYEMSIDECRESIIVVVPLETDIVQISASGEDPERLKELVQAVKAVGHSMIAAMPQVGRIQWVDGQTAVYDGSAPPLQRAITFGGILALAGIVLGLGLAFVLVLLDRRVHFVDEIDPAVAPVTALILAKRGKGRVRRAAQPTKQPQGVPTPEQPSGGHRVYAYAAPARPTPDSRQVDAPTLQEVQQKWSMWIKQAESEAADKYRERSAEPPRAVRSRVERQALEEPVRRGDVVKQEAARQVLKEDSVVPAATVDRKDLPKRAYPPLPVDDTALLFAMQLLQAVEEKPGACILLLPVDELHYYKQAVCLLAAALRMLRERVLLLDFSEDYAFYWSRDTLLDGVERFPAALLRDKAPLEQAERYAALLRGHDVTIAVYPRLAASADTLHFMQHCDCVVPLAQLHKTRLADVKRTVNRLEQMQQNVHGVACTCRRRADLRRNPV